MRDSIMPKEPMLRRDVDPAKPEGGAQAKPREGIVVSTVMRLTTSDGRTFEESTKAIEHEAFYQILKHIVKELGWSDNEESASFAMKLARYYRSLLPVLMQLDKDAETLRAHLREYQQSM